MSGITPTTERPYSFEARVIWPRAVWPRWIERLLPPPDIHHPLIEVEIYPPLDNDRRLDEDTTLSTV